MQDLPEKEIIQKIQNGEINYFELLVKKYSQILLRYTKIKTENEQDSHDIVQNSFIKSYKAINRFDLQKPFYPFIFTILKNEISEFYRKNRKHFQLNEDIAQNNNEDNNLSIEYIFQKIKKQYKEVLELYYIQGFSYKEISDKINKPINTIKTLLRRAKMEAKEIYEKS